MYKYEYLDKFLLYFPYGNIQKLMDSYVYRVYYNDRLKYWLNIFIINA